MSWNYLDAVTFLFQFVLNVVLSHFSLQSNDENYCDVPQSVKSKFSGIINFH